MNLLNRVRNVLGLAPSKQTSRWWPIGVLMIVLPLTFWVVATGFVGDQVAQVLADDDDRPREGERKRDGDARDRERGEREQPRGEREGDREREGNREREGDRPREVDRERDGDRRPDQARRDGERRDWTPRERELIAIIRELQEQVQQLRREVQAIRGKSRYERDRPRQGDRPRDDDDDRPRETDRPRDDDDK